jgi:hypothetical protein
MADFTWCPKCEKRFSLSEYDALTHCPYCGRSHNDAQRSLVLGAVVVSIIWILFWVFWRKPQDLILPAAASLAIAVAAGAFAVKESIVSKVRLHREQRAIENDVIDAKSIKRFWAEETRAREPAPFVQTHRNLIDIARQTVSDKTHKWRAEAPAGDYEIRLAWAQVNRPEAFLFAQALHGLRILHETTGAMYSAAWLENIVGDGVKEVDSAQHADALQKLRAIRARLEEQVNEPKNNELAGEIRLVSGQLKEVLLNASRMYRR